MFKKIVITSLIIANMYTPIYGGGMSVDALHQAEFYRTSLNPVISENVECAFENGNILLDFSYENTGETNLWTLKVLYKPGTFDPEVIEIIMDNGNVHSIGMNSGSALSGSNGYEVITVTFTDQVDVNIFEAGVYYNAVLPENPEKEILEDELKAGDTPIVEEPKKELEQEAIIEEPEDDIVVEVPKESIDFPEVEVPKESVDFPEVEVPKKREIIEEPEAEVPELPKEEQPMAEIDEIEELEINDGQEDTRQPEEEQVIESVVSNNNQTRNIFLSVIGVETVILAVLLFMLIRYKKL